MDRYNADTNQITSPIKAIRMKCLDCCGYQLEEVKQCTCVKDCPLYPFRFGKNPFSHRTMSDEQKAKAAERLSKARAQKTENNS